MIWEFCTGSEPTQASSRIDAAATKASPKVCRAAVQSLGSWQWGVDTESATAKSRIIGTVHRLKGLARSRRLAIMMSIPAGQFGLRNPHYVSRTRGRAFSSDVKNCHMAIQDRGDIFCHPERNVRESFHWYRSSEILLLMLS